VKVLILSQHFPPEPEFKGLPLAKRLSDEGHDVRVLTGCPNYPGGRLYPGYRWRMMQRETIDGIQVIRMGSYLSHNRNGAQRALSYLSFAAACLLALPLLRFRPQAIYIYNLVTLVPVAVVARGLWGSRVVLDVQDLWPESVTASGMMGRKPVPTLLGRLCDAAYKTADVVIAQSPGFARRLSDRGVRADRVRVIYNWAPHELERTATEHGLSDGFRIVYAGNVGTVQALDVVLVAATVLKDRLPTVKFSIVGAGTEFERLRKAATHLPNVEFLGRMPPAQLEPLIQRADALLLHLADAPIFRITIPSKLQQYLQAGRPILCGVAGDASTLVEEAGAGLPFRSGDPDDLVRVVVDLATRSLAIRSAMAAQGKAFYRERLSRDHGVAAIIETLCVA